VQKTPEVLAAQLFLPKRKENLHEWRNVGLEKISGELESQVIFTITW